MAIKELASEGWPVDEHELRQQFRDEYESFIRDLPTLRKALCDMDIRNYSVPVLADRLNKQLGVFKGPLVLQIVKTRNVSYPKVSDYSYTEGLIKTQLTDGHTNVFALQFDPIPDLNTETPPGTKVCLSDAIRIENGMLIINSRTCSVLGGNVNLLVEKWNVEKNFALKSNRNTDSAAPKWIPFSKAIGERSEMQRANTPSRSTGKPFRANDVIANSKKVVKDSENDDGFSAARKANIEQVKDYTTAKKFAPSQIRLNNMSIANSPLPRSNNDTQKGKKFQTRTEQPQRPQRNVGIKGRGYRRNNESDEEDESNTQRPSASLTLFDFVTSQVPVTPQNANSISQQYDQAQSIPKSVPLIPNTRYNYRGDENRQRQDHSEFDKKGRDQGRVSVSGPAISEVRNPKYYPRQDKKQMGFSYGTTRVTDDAAARSGYLSNSANFPPVEAASSDLRSLYINSTIKNTQKEQNRPINQFSLPGMPKWKTGDKCLAPWTDGQFYMSTVISVGPPGMCTVKYDEYGNFEVLPLGALLIR